MGTYCEGCTRRISWGWVNRQYRYLKFCCEDCKQDYIRKLQNSKPIIGEFGKRKQQKKRANRRHREYVKKYHLS